MRAPLQLSELLPVWENIFSSAAFFQDSWSLLFLGLIAGIGILVAIHAWGYFREVSQRAKFYTVFFPFALAMAGVVSFDHVLLVFIAWEATSVLSYFLITFKGEGAAARRGGQQSLLITGLGGLCLLGGFLLLGMSEGVWTLSSAAQVNLANNPYGGWIAVLILIGAMTKSAQFPFHFWLPGAMTAPTPASAYLHSATMVKAGIYLMYRLWPMLSTIEAVPGVVFTLGFITFGWGAFVSLLQLDLKGVLAGTTVAHLGLMTAMIAWPDHDLTKALFALVLAHASYKAGLFLFSGVVEKLSGTRRIDLMNGLRRESPLMFALGLVLAGASLGLPGTLAYHAKGLIHLPMIWKAALTLGFLILGKAGLLVAVRPFLGQGASEPKETKSGLHLMWIPPLLLGLFSWIAVPIGWVQGTDWSPGNLLLSLGAAAIAITLLQRWSPDWQAVLNRGPWFQGDEFFDRIWYLHLDFAKFVRGLIHPDSLRLYLLIVLTVFATGLLVLLFGTGVLGAVPWPVSVNWYDVFIWLCLGQVAATLLVLRTKEPILSILFLGFVGYLLAVIFALAGAPDLAMTQFAVETLSLLVLLYALKGVAALPRTPGLYRMAGAIVSVAVGVGVAGATAAAALTTKESRLREFFSEASWNEAHGRNVVNVILVDFRALDTLGEITVLGVVALGVFLLLSRPRKVGEP